MFYLYSFRIALQTRLRKKSSHLFLLLALLLAVAIVMDPDESEDSKVSVGVVMPVSGAEELFSLIQDRSLSLIAYVVTDEHTMDQKILSGEFDCGIILPENIDERLTEQDFRRLITIKIGPASTVYPIVQECLSACILELMNPYIVQEYLLEMGLDPSLAGESLQKWDTEECWIDVILETANGKMLDPVAVKQSGDRRLMQGLIAVFTLIWGLYLTVDLGNWLRLPVVLRMRTVRTVTALLLPQLSASLLPTLLWGILMIVLLGGGVFSLLGYCLLVGLMLVIGLLIPRYKAIFQSVIALIPFVVIGILLLEPVLLDVGLLFPVIRSVTRFFPVSLFLSISDGSWGAVGILVLEIGILAVMSLMLDRLEKRVA